MIILQEGLTGKTIGKRILKIRVVQEGALEPSVGASIIRHLFDIVDLFFLIGLMFAAASAKKQRIGDRIAKTVVVVGR